MYAGGDFRSDKCLGLLEESDVVVTNPPFSKFTTFVKQVSKKRFLILGDTDSVSNDFIKPNILDDKIWLGVNGRVRWFRTPTLMQDACQSRKTKNEKTGSDEFFVRLKGTYWYTNLEPSESSKSLLVAKPYNENEHAVYDNYPAVHCDSKNNIPISLPPGMPEEFGVPTSFFDDWNKDQFEIVGFSKDVIKTKGKINGDLLLKGKKKPMRVIVKKR